MGWRNLHLRIFWLYALCAHVWVHAQTPSTSGAAGNVQTVEAALQQMSGRAGIIFIGTVADIHRTDGTGLGPGVVEIRFTIDQALRGCSGSTYTLREWGGLWAANDARYRIGQRLLVLLHAPGPSGLSSPVSGMDGAIPLRASGAGVRQTDKSSAAPSEPVADLRWIALRVVRTVSYRIPNSPAAAVSRPMIEAASAAAAPDQSDSSTPAQELAVSTVVGMLQAWEVSNNVTR